MSIAPRPREEGDACEAQQATCRQTWQRLRTFLRMAYCRRFKLSRMRDKHFVGPSRRTQ